MRGVFITVEGVEGVPACVHHVVHGGVARHPQGDDQDQGEVLDLVAPELPDGLDDECPLRPVWCEAQEELVGRLKTTNFQHLLEQQATVVA